MTKFRNLLWPSVLFLAACGSVPALTAPPVVPNPPSDAPDLDRPERQQMNRELHALYDACVETREHLSDDVDDAKDEEAVLSGAAIGATVAGAAASDVDNPPDSTDIVGDGRQSGNVRTGPATVEMRDAEAHMRAINEALDALSAFLFAHPGVSEWSDAERDQYSALVLQVRRRCRP